MDFFDRVSQAFLLPSSSCLHMVGYLIKLFGISVSIRLLLVSRSRHFIVFQDHSFPLSLRAVRTITTYLRAIKQNRSYINQTLFIPHIWKQVCFVLSPKQSYQLCVSLPTLQIPVLSFFICDAKCYLSHHSSAVNSHRLL